LKNAKTIFIAVLNWGLGHATRTLPIIYELQRQGAHVIVGSDGAALALLQKELPDTLFIELPPYDVQYATQSMFLNIGAQMPKILYAIYKEHRFMEELVDTYNIDAIFSDNRYGCFSKKVKSVFMTHQLNIKIGIRPFEQIIGRINRAAIHNFHACWVPDFEGEPNLSGKLSHGVDMPDLTFIGTLSRMKPLEDVKPEYDAIAVLSGPEPQRTYFETMMIEQAKQSTYRILIIGGKTDIYEEKDLQSNVRYISYLTSEALNRAIASAYIVIARSGYSTIMDIMAMGKNAILIPTTGQTEQEYLAQYFLNKKIYFSQSQKHFDLKEAMEKQKSYKSLQNNEFSTALLTNAVQKLLATEIIT
jgi:UDP-N-acetylglucosamine transferase subunit ALG13